MTSPPTPSDADGTLLLSGMRFRAVVWSVVLAAVGYLGFALWSGWREVVDAIGKVGVVGVAIALVLSLVNYGLRFVRWQDYLRAMHHPVSWPPSARIYLAGFALTTTPGKAGEALRGVLLKRWGVPYPTSLAALVSERLSDLLAVLLLTLFGLSAYPAARPIVAVCAVGVALLFVLLSNKRAIERLRQRVERWERAPSLVRHLVQILSQANRCHSPGLLAKATALSVVAWGAEAWAFHLVLQWMDVDVALSLAVFIYAASMLAGALSFMPGGLGGAEAAMISLLTWAGATTSEAIASTVLIRLTTLWFAVLLGALFLARLDVGARRLDAS